MLFNLNAIAESIVIGSDGKYGFSFKPKLVAEELRKLADLIECKETIVSNVSVTNDIPQADFVQTIYTIKVHHSIKNLAD